MQDRQDPAILRKKERALRAKKTERNIVGAVLDLYPVLRYQRLLDLVRDYRAQCLESMAGQAITDLHSMGVLQGRAQALAWLTEGHDDLVRKAESLDREIQGLEHDLESAHKPLSDRMADTTRRS